MSLCPPENIEEAIERLPQKDHPLIDDDLAIAYLYECRESIEQAVRFGPENVDIGFRIVDLDSDEFRLMEQTSFYKDPKNSLDFGWAKLEPESIWSFELGHPNIYKRLEYAYWKITNALPSKNEDYRIVFIESDSQVRHHQDIIRRNNDNRIMLAILSVEELTEIIDLIHGLDRCTEGDVKSFIEGTE